MDNKLFFFAAVLVQLKLTQSLERTVSGEILENVTFIHRTFPVPPSMRAIIEVDVLLPDNLRGWPRYATMGIYTTPDHINIKKQCTHSWIGQLANQDLHFKIEPPRDLNCEVASCNMLHFTRNITVQDFKPRNFSFSFGFWCDTTSAPSPLKNLVYNITIRGQTNETKCIQLTRNHTCYRYMQYRISPNLLSSSFKTSDASGYEFFMLNYNKLFGQEPCYQYDTEYVCYTLQPKCDPETQQVVHPCREMCHDAENACFFTKGLNCDYLPALDGGIPCFYEPVFCTAPPRVKNATVKINSSSRYEHFLYDTAQYSCDEGYDIVGNKNITCTYLGQWSTPPTCSPIIKSKPNPLSFVLPIIILLLLLPVLIFTIRYKIQLRKKRKAAIEIENDPVDMTFKEEKKPEIPIISPDTVSPLKRKRIFDAFVLYHFDTDDSFVIDYLQPELEENRNFKLCIHSRNFTPGRDIKDNIEEAIEGSNSAIIVMSQGFVDSMWCKEEFTHCYIENMKDAAFNLFVIMMQPTDTLVNISNYMKMFFETTTYLQRHDPELFTKLAALLEASRKQENDEDENKDDIPSDEEQMNEFRLVWQQDDSLETEETIV